ncbi:zinc-dependent alcohol dehydrogenase [Pectinatus haikarae]|uniref:zinc-dependent alcohol dehydrogenase n=1 Tax=Pectinatus haikarae TaxID=349096 RepID=UPI0018C56188|nr:zinc-binding dehydrogenase [Pectinatus haikarae]
MEKMKTVVFTDVKKVHVEECAIPQVPSDKILIKVDSCAICTWEQRVYLGIKKVEFPFIGGHEMVGKIIAMGDKVNREQWHINDKAAVGVTLACHNCFSCKTGNEQNCPHFDHSKQLDGLPHRGMGGMSSHLLADPVNLFKYDKISAQEATITEPLSCVIHSVETADIQLGEVVVVIGCGIMGLLHVLLSVRKGAAVIVSDTNEERTKLALELGAKYAINPVAENLEKRVSEITGGVKAQAVFDTTPIGEVVEEARKCLANNGRLVLYSSFYPDKPITFSADWVHKSAVQIMGTANSNTRDFIKAVRLLSYKIIDVRPFISEVYPVERVQEAFESACRGDKFRVVIDF